MARPGSTATAQAEVAPEHALAALRAVAAELHTMSQPMTALLCSLEIGSMTGTVEGYAGAVRDSLVQCDRLMQSIAAMRAAIVGAAEHSWTVQGP